ncbi:uncharacterized protein CcaverHIS019_0307530 [Cutaneotrichosporon cavernicola]|uniref:DNA damage-binding protein CMR1 n=1 Tax=Cutaneotrichosporon cavernicola TaxID=279322 RepID=A0AA48L2U9_9TREE|nr:uncharacterized protein CcaverHIS019_0307530 [Cutaneotrichosporon cavernicola]BEI90683.1 hypothetical protein CcaverHIS019_0307530 [Cutaneotrichosporon cavernicola]
MPKDNEYELERQKTIAENRALLDSLGLDSGGEAKLHLTPAPKPKPAATRKRKAPPAKVEREPRRRSGRIAGLEADGYEAALKQAVEEKAVEEARVRDRRPRRQMMPIAEMHEEDLPPVKAEDESEEAKVERAREEERAKELEAFLTDIAEKKAARTFPSMKDSAHDAYADADALPAEVARLKDAFKGMVLSANAKVTTERVFSMVVHPEPTKNLVLVGDKYGQLGIWDALGPSFTEADEGEDTEGRVWRVQAHAKNSISCMKVDPIAGSSLYSSSYDCSLRKLDFATCVSTEQFAFDDDDMLITHFDLTPSGQEAWLVDKNGGISHCDFREGGERRRWVVQEGGRAAKLGGVSVNPLQPHLICTAGNDQHLRIWDVRHLGRITPKAAESLAPPEDRPDEALDTFPTSSIPVERIENYMQGSKGKGLLRAAYQHGKSCSAAYWDPTGRRILTTSYDDKLRIWTLNPQSFILDQPLPVTQFKPSKSIIHNCQTGRWLTILRANWSLNTDYMPHFTVGNMKRTLDVFAATGDKIVALWAEGHIRSLQSTHLILRSSDLDPTSLPSLSDDTRTLVIADSGYRALSALLPLLPSSTLLVVPIAHKDPAPDSVHRHARRIVCAGRLDAEARAAIVGNGMMWLGERIGLAAEYRVLEEGLVAVQTAIAAEACASARALGVTSQVAYDYMMASQGRSWSIEHQGPTMLELENSPPGLTLSTARAALRISITLAASLSPPVPTPMRSAAWQAYISTASWHRDPHTSGTDPSATVVNSYPSPGRIAEQLAGPGHSVDAPRRLEIIRRLLRHANAAVLAETLGLASGLGMQVGDVVQCLAQGPGGSWVLDTMGEAMRCLRAGERLADIDIRSPDRSLDRAVSRTRRDQTSVATALEELSSVLDVMNSIPLAMPVAASAQQVFVLATAQGLGDEDEVAITRLWA